MQTTDSLKALLMAIRVFCGRIVEMSEPIVANEPVLSAYPKKSEPIVEMSEMEKI